MFLHLFYWTFSNHDLSHNSTETILLKVISGLHITKPNDHFFSH